MKRIAALIIVLTLVLSSLTACGNSENATSAGQPETSAGKDSTAPDAKDDTVSGTDTRDSASDEADDEDLAEINILFWTLNTIPGDLEMVEGAINEITREKINTEINLQIVDMGSYAQQVNLAISSGEKLDLMVTLPGDTAHFNAMTSQNQLRGLSTLLEEYAPDLMKTIPDQWLTGTTVDGEIYSVTSFGDKATPLCFICRTDILEKTGIEPSTIKNAHDLTNLFAKVKEIEPSMIPLTGGNKGFLTAPYMIDADGNFFSYEGLGEGNNSIIAIMPGDGSTISDRYETEEFKATSKWSHSWYEAGYIDKDLANKEETQEAGVQAGTAFGYFKMLGGGEYGAVSAAQATGYDMTAIVLDNAVINTGLIRKFTWAVPQGATEPEAAVKFLNLLYTDEKVLNLITWGIEDVHYKTLADGTIDFMDGQDASSCGYFLGDCTSILGNGFLAKVRAGQPANLREQLYELNMSAQVSEFLGFGIDNGPVENTLTALANVINELRPVVSSGVEEEDGVDRLVAKLKGADVDSYVATMQQQLDDWIAANK